MSLKSGKYTDKIYLTTDKVVKNPELMENYLLEQAFVKVNSRRYAHEKCALSEEEHKSKEQKDREALEAYILQLFKIEYINPKIRKQIDNYIKENKYTYTGIHKALVYPFYRQNMQTKQPQYS